MPFNVHVKTQQGLTTRVGGRRAFQNGRTIATAGAPEALLHVLQSEKKREPAVAAAACNALRRIVVNDDICNKFADAGGVDTTMQVINRLPPC